MIIRLMKPSTLMALTCSTAMMALAPITVNFDTKTAMISIAPAYALAKGSNDGNSGSGGDNDDDGDDNDDDEDEDDEDDDDEDDADDEDDGDHGGDDEDEDDDNGSDDDNDDNDDNDDDEDEDGEDDDAPGDDDDEAGGGSTDPVSIVKFETGENSLEVTLSDGSKIEIEDGRYQYKDGTGRTLVERPATQADVDKWIALR